MFPYYIFMVCNCGLELMAQWQFFAVERILLLDKMQTIEEYFVLQNYRRVFQYNIVYDLSYSIPAMSISIMLSMTCSMALGSWQSV